MKKVYVFGTRGFPGVQGGVEKHCERLYPELVGQYEIVVFRRIPFLPQNAEKHYKGIRFIDLPSTRLKGFESCFHSFISTLFCVWKRPSIVHIHNIGPGMFIPLLKLTRLKVVLTYHSANYEHKKWNYIARKILKFSEWIALRGSDAIIFVNKYQLERFDESIKRKSVYIPNGVEIQSPSTRTDYIEALGLSPQKYILAVGRITQEKGFDYLIESYLKTLPHDYRLVLAGGIDHASDYAAQIRDMAQKHHIVMPGYVDGEPLRQLYSHAKLFILPSYNEGFPLVLLEAMSYRLPLLASDISANKLLELNPDDYFQTGNVIDLAKHIQRKLSYMGEHPHYSLRAYTWNNIGEQVAQIYERL